VSLELGPIFRALSRRKSAFALIVLELASGFTIICCMMMAGWWYQKVGTVHSSGDDEALVEVTLHRPLAGGAEPEPATGGAAWQAGAEALIAGTPGVVAVASVNTTLLDDRITMPSLLRVDDGRATAGWTIHAGLALPEVLGLRVVEGPSFAQLPPASRPGTVVISRCLRDQLFARGERAIGRHLTAGDFPAARVVAVVEDVYLRRPFMADTQCQPFYFGPSGDERNARFLLRTSPAARAALVDTLAAALGGKWPETTVAVKPYTLENARHYKITHGILLMLVIMAVNVGFLALLGPLAVSSFLVAERTRQIGVRRALGATRGDIIRYFLVENALAVTLGTAIGAVVTAILMLAMRGAFFSIGLSPWQLLLAAFLLWLDGTLAALLPALRAARIAPSVATKAL
jgi:putative ABC transport system permease protein